MKSLLIIFMFLCFNVANATTYYVDNTTTNCDTNPHANYDPITDTCGSGSYTVYDHPQDAADIVDPGDTVIVADSTYTDTNADDIIIKIDRGGSIGSIVTFKSETKWGATLDGESNDTNYAITIVDGVDYVRIDDFEIKDVAKIAITNNNSDSDNLHFYRNYIHEISRRCTESASGAAGIFTTSSSNDIVIDSNLIHTIGRYHNSEGNCGYPSGFDYDDNHDHGMYLNGSDITVTNNIFYDNDSGWDIQVNDASTNFEISNNTFDSYGVREGQILLRDDLDNILVQNNIFNDPDGAGISARSDHCISNTNIVIKNNISTIDTINYVCSNYTYSNNSEDATINLVDPDNNDYHLTLNSPAIDAGLNTGAPTLDYDEDVRDTIDIGADEYCPNLVKVVSTTYSSVQSAYDPSSTGSTLLMPANTIFVEDLTLDDNKTITMEGGYSCNFTSQISDTLVNGDMVISDGTVNIDNIHIMED